MAKPASLDTALVHAADQALARLAELPPANPPEPPKPELPPTSAALPEQAAALPVQAHVNEAAHLPDWLLP